MNLPSFEVQELDIEVNVLNPDYADLIKVILDKFMSYLHEKGIFNNVRNCELSWLDRCDITLDFCKEYCKDDEKCDAICDELILQVLDLICFKEVSKTQLHGVFEVVKKDRKEGVVMIQL